MNRLSKLIAASLGTLLFSTQAHAGTESASATVTSSATLLRPVALSSSANLAFGRIVLPSSGTGSVTIGTSADTVAASGGAVALAGGSPSRAAFSVSGEGGQAVTVTVPATVTMSGPSSSTMAVTLTSSVSGSTNLSGSLGAAGSATFYVGGSFAPTATTTTGAYSGTFTVTVAYQ
ncbi:DUF4402 domain-containing protein [Novosphingobium sp. AAP93]|uniref:DUF4402 domain-containing protein n=1 Tax=Novosphingobium sp. AAP93 TaxID=1523427 RepID=UPI0006B96C63|nr:DUF4402 domain-containing protein [Novosphingobium sp. AAP93]